MKRLMVVAAAMMLAGCAVKPMNNCKEIVAFMDKIHSQNIMLDNPIEVKGTAYWVRQCELAKMQLAKGVHPDVINLQYARNMYKDGGCPDCYHLAPNDTIEANTYRTIVYIAYENLQNNVNFK